MQEGIKRYNLMQYSVYFWDALIVAAAERAECNILFTEDLKMG